MLLFDGPSAGELFEESLIRQHPAVDPIAKYLGRDPFEKSCVGAYKLADQGQGFAFELTEIPVLLNPALSEGSPFETSATSAPSTDFRPNAVVISRVTVWIDTPLSIHACSFLWRLICLG